MSNEVDGWQEIAQSRRTRLESLAREYVDGDEDVRATAESNVKDNEVGYFLGLIFAFTKDEKLKSVIGTRLKQHKMLAELIKKVNEMEDKFVKPKEEEDVIVKLQGQLDELSSKMSERDAEITNEDRVNFKEITEKLAQVLGQRTNNVEPFKRVFLDKSTPKFFGRHEEDVDLWIYRIEKKFGQCGMPAGGKVEAVADFLDGQAFHVYKELDDRGVQNWPEFKREFRARFTMADKAIAVRDKMNALRQTGSVAEYNDKFLELKAQAGKMEEQDALYFYLKGLESQMSMLVRKGQQKSLMESMKEALAMDVVTTRGVNYVKPINKMRNFNRGPEGQKSCFECGKTKRLLEES